MIQDRSWDPWLRVIDRWTEPDRSIFLEAAHKVMREEQRTRAPVGFWKDPAGRLQARQSEACR